MNNDAFAHINDQELLEKFYLTKENHWLGILLQRHTLLLLGVCMKYLKNEDEAKDAVQQVFLKAIIEMQKYRVDYFRSWLYMVARNYCLMHLRNKNGKPAKKLNDTLAASEEELLLNEHIEKDKLLMAMEASLFELNSEQKTCVTLFYLQKKTYHEISEQTGFSLMQVKSHIQNGKRNLKILVEKKMHSNE